MSADILQSGSEYWPWVIWGMKLKITDSLLALFTLALVIIGAIQARRLRQTVESFITGERPHIFIGSVIPEFFRRGPAALYSQKEGVPEPKVKWTYKNYGRSPGVITQIQTELFLGKTLPRKKKFFYSEPQSGETIIGANGDPEKGNAESSFLTSKFDKIISVEEENSIREFKQNFFFFGHIKYRDMFDNTYKYDFGFEVTQGPSNKRIIIMAGGKKYNSTKRC